MSEAERAIERVARESYGRLISYLAARGFELSAAEDALSDAFVSALATWPTRGLPDKPEAWLLSTARNRLLDRARHQRVVSEAGEALHMAAEEATQLAEAAAFPDERLKLMFVCAHPAVAREAHTPLMLQVVLGLSSERIARAFVTLPATMAQRLSRAKAKIREAGIAFAVPSERELPERLEAVLSAIYASYGSGWEELSDASPERELTDEALWLARLLCSLLPDQPEVLGLTALLLYCEARRDARRDERGSYVPLEQQDVARFHMPLLREADQLLAVAGRQARLGRFQLEAAIQSAHMERAHGRAIDWRGIALLYEGLVRQTPALGARVGRASALARVVGHVAGLSALDALPQDEVLAYQPYWAVRAHLLQRLGRTREARECYTQAIALSRDPASTAFLEQRCAALADDART